MKNSFFISLLLFNLLGCSPSADKELISCIIIIPNNLQFVRVSYYYINKIAYDSEEPLQYVIEIENDADHALNNLYLTINYKWSASLKNINKYNGFFKGFQPYGESSFPAKSKLQIVLNNKSANRKVFTDSTGRHPSDLSFIHALHLKSDQGSGSWGFPDP